MDWPQVIGIACWCFIFGVFIGAEAEKKAPRRKGPLDEAIDDGIREVKSIETFAGLQAISRIQLRDHDGSAWLISVERADA